MPFKDLPLDVAQAAERVANIAALPVGEVAGSIRYVDDQSALYVYDGSGWTKLAASSGGGSIVGPLSSTSNALVRWSGTDGTTIKDSAVTAADTGEITSASLTASRALVSGASKEIQSSSVTAMELGYVSGVTSAIQTQIAAKQATITGAASSVVSADLAVSRAVVSDGSGKVAAATTTAAEIGYVNGVTSAIQTQIDAKQPLDSDLTAVAGLATTGLIARTAAGTASTRTVTAGSSKVAITNGDGVSGNPTVDVTEANLTVSNMAGVLAADHGGTGVANNAAATTTRAGNFAKTETLTGVTSITYPVSGTLATVAGSETLTNKTLSGNTAATLISGSGTLTLNTSGTITVPNGTDTLVGKATADTLTNKTLTAPVINSPTGIVKADVGLGNVDNTSDATKNAASATLTNKNLASSTNTLTGATAGSFINTGTISLPTATGTLALNPTTTRGDLVYASATASPGTLSRVAIGTAGKLLRSDGTDPSWTFSCVTASKSANYAITDSDGLSEILVTTASSTISITMPQASTNTNREITIRKVDGGTGAIQILKHASDGSTVFDGLYSSQDLGYGASGRGSWIRFFSNGTNWYVLGVNDYRQNLRSTATPSITTSIVSIDSGNTTQNDGNETGVTLCPGTWDLIGSAYFTTTGAVAVTLVQLSIGTAKGASLTGQSLAENTTEFDINMPSSAETGVSTPFYRVRITADTTYYLKSQIAFTGGTSVTAVGNLSARRAV